MKIFIIDDHSSVRESYKRWLEASGYQVVGDSGSIDDALKLIKSTKPDIILMDIDFPDTELGGIEICKRIKEINRETKIIFVTHFNEPEIIIEACKSGASGYFTKSDSLKSLKRIIEEVSEGFMSFSPKALKSLLSNFTQTGNTTHIKSKKVKYVLDDEELKIVNYIAQGYSNKEIANFLHTNEKKIKNEISNILLKVNAKNRAQLIYIVLKDGLID